MRTPLWARPILFIASLLGIVVVFYGKSVQQRWGISIYKPRKD